MLVRVKKILTKIFVLRGFENVFVGFFISLVFVFLVQILGIPSVSAGWCKDPSVCTCYNHGPCPPSLLGIDSCYSYSTSSGCQSTGLHEMGGTLWRWVCNGDCYSNSCGDGGGGGGGGDDCHGSQCNGCWVGMGFCADNCTECPASEYVSQCVSGQKYCRVTSCGCCDKPCDSGNDPGGNDPVGNFDGATCDNNGVISGWGWTCDADDYNEPLAVQIYEGGVSTGTIIASVEAKEYRGEPAFEGVCGGKRYHGFVFSTNDTFSSGNHSLNALGINIGGGGNSILVGSPKTVTCPPCTKINGGLSGWSNCTAACGEYGNQLATCTNPAPRCGGSDCTTNCSTEGGFYDADLGICVKSCYGGPCCTVNQGTLSDWGNCSGGKQTRTCTGATCCGSTCGNCNGAVLERPCLRIDGNVWSDDDRNGTITLSDYWKKDSNTPTNCSTNKTFSNFYMTVSGETSPLNQISEWWCHPNGYGVYFNTPYTVEPESTKTATLTNVPSGYDIFSWNYRYLKDGVITSLTGSGGVAPNLPMPPYANWVNLHWELKQQTYNLTINVKKILPEIIDLPSRCGDSEIYNGALQGAQITVTDADDTANVVCSGTSNSDGNLTCPIWILQGALNITATKSVGGLTPETYSLQCPNSNVYVYNPNPSPVKGDSRTADIGLQTGYKDGWVSAIDSDIFAGRLNVIVPAGPTDNLNSGQTPQGFAKTLINSSGNTDRYLGFAFSETGGVSNSPNDPKKIFETRFGITLGGNAYNLRGNSKEHDSEWLKNFTFTPPSGAVQLSTIGNSFKANTVYKISQDDHGTIELPNSYRITDGTGVSILYFEGDLVIRNNVTNITPGNGRLLVIVNGSVTISESVGTTLTYPAGPTNYMSQDPHIMVGIIASEEIIFKSISGTKTETNRDKMIMVSAPLIAKNSMNSASGITFGRDLYHDNNATMPAESAKEYNKYLYLLTSLEREKSQDNLYFTGVTTYDLDWEYIY